ncbi:MAG: KH domain-containing protein [Nanoarchaeota archaeon]|nr:KH domain-containing protein [Nanoarchaeota archaeon]
MAREIDMQVMRYLNLFSKVTRVSTMNCFVYNNQILFAVPKSKVSFAIGKDAVNIRKLRDILRRKIKVVAMPEQEDRSGISKFVEDVVKPIEFTKLDYRDGSVVVTAGRQSKAALIGRNRIREKEIGYVLKNLFGIEKFKIM